LAAICYLFLACSVGGKTKNTLPGAEEGVNFLWLRGIRLKPGFDAVQNDDERDAVHRAESAGLRMIIVS
jgi:hypothetical protein